MEHFYQNLSGENWFTYPNLYKEMVEKCSADSTSHFVEVGSWKGRSASFMGVEIINSNKIIKFDCVDTWKGSIEHTTYDVITEEKLYDVFLTANNPSNGAKVVPFKLTTRGFPFSIYKTTLKK